MSLLPSRFAIPLILLTASFQSALAFSGASVPWTTYYSREMSTNGTRMGPGYQPFTVEAESADAAALSSPKPDSMSNSELANGPTLWLSATAFQTRLPGEGLIRPSASIRTANLFRNLRSPQNTPGFTAFILGPTIRPTVIPGIFMTKSGCQVQCRPRRQNNSPERCQRYVALLYRHPGRFRECPASGNDANDRRLAFGQKPPYNATGNGVTDDSPPSLIASGTQLLSTKASGYRQVTTWSRTTSPAPFQATWVCTT